MTPDDALLSLSAIEQAVYDPPRPCESHEHWNAYYFVPCKYCGRQISRDATESTCPSRPASDPDWQACLFAADICEDVLQDPALGAWWRWLERERKVPTIHRDVWDWWKPDASSIFPDHARIERSLYRRLSFRRFEQGRYDTRRAAYLDLARVVCDQWRQEHEMRKELTV